ncbi:hypothetical protein [Roseomonas indoligenes]|uniref:Uncharacterized protein n=1 Tax=Roseomonas indoligenes TaxID=2820811 RepID=A0A940N4R2_9PROT|nr:hypothetical protein [Pararoseomonas indoligenes]MBP0495946.1 hypothetical protein [Pararoseomonas indoligenes]
MSGSAFYFGIPLLSKQVSPNWELTCSLVSRTVESCLLNEDADVRVVIACHEVPELKLSSDNLLEKVTFLQSDTPPPANDASKMERRQDKHRKMGALVEHASKDGSCHLFVLDADDVVSNSIVSHIRSKGNTSIIFRVGYVFNEKTQEIYLRERFDQFCGSACALFFGANGKGGTNLDGDGLSKVPMSHKLWQKLIERFGGAWQKSREPHVVYIKNHGSNLSFLGDDGVFDPSRPLRFEAQFSEERIEETAEKVELSEIAKVFPLLRIQR